MRVILTFVVPEGNSRSSWALALLFVIPKGTYPCPYLALCCHSRRESAFAFLRFLFCLSFPKGICVCFCSSVCHSQRNLSLPLPFCLSFPKGTCCLLLLFCLSFPKGTCCSRLPGAPSSPTASSSVKVGSPTEASSNSSQIQHQTHDHSNHQTPASSDTKPQRHQAPKARHITA